MRILFDQGVFDLRNKGNVALTQVAVRRIHALWPQARLDVMTSAPHILRLYCPEARAIRPDGTAPTGLPARLLGTLPVPLLRSLLEAREAAWNRGAEGGQPAEHAAPPGSGPARSAARRAVPPALLDGTDLLVVTGAQFMSDPCRDDALGVLDRLEAAADRGIPTVMVGQGVGPFDDPELRARCRVVYPRVDAIFVRDPRTALPLLGELGVEPSRIVVTGDDAIELAYERRRGAQGANIGVSLRASHYTRIERQDTALLSNALRVAAAGLQTRLVALPISFSRHELDERILADVIGPDAPRGVGTRFESPEELVDRVATCRLVVTGAFHTAVFALSQGIPAVGVARTRMYLDKFRSLADQFGDACQLVALADADADDQLACAIRRAWERAAVWQGALLDAALQRIELSRAAYQRLATLVRA